MLNNKEQIFMVRFGISNTGMCLGDCNEILPLIPDACVDSIVTDPPYGISFMGKHWDHGVPSAEVWAECLRVLKPGGHLLSFAGTRTQHRMACNIEDAGFEIRDMIAWVYGNGFPKGANIGKQIDKAAGAERPVVETIPDRWAGKGAVYERALEEDRGATVDITAPATDDAKKWDGWRSALKPALEPITVARKPFKGPLFRNVQEHGTGAFNVDGCRVGTEKWERPASNAVDGIYGDFANDKPRTGVGRYPANLIHDGGAEVLSILPEGADRFFYCAKASAADRGAGNKHPTVKPTDLMRHLCRLVTPPEGLILDPFMGSGSTGKAALLESFRFLGVELDQESFETAQRRCQSA